MAVPVRHSENNHPRADRSTDRSTVATGSRLIVDRIENRPMNRAPESHRQSGDDSSHDSIGLILPDHGMIAITITAHSSRAGVGVGLAIRETNRICRPFQFGDVVAPLVDGPGQTFPLSAKATATATGTMIDSGDVVRRWSVPMSTTCPEPCARVAVRRTMGAPGVSFGMPIAVECTQCVRPPARIGSQLRTHVPEQYPCTTAGHAVCAVRRSGRRPARPRTTPPNGGIVDTLVRGSDFRSPVGRIRQPCWK
jgi:hypothetical protein